MQTIDQEINILLEFNKTTSNDTQKQYIDLQVKRLELEKATYKQMIEDQVLGNEIINSYANAVNDVKTETMTFLTTHPDLKENLESWNIDEDFLVKQTESYK